MRTMTPPLSWAVAKASLQLDSLSASFIVDASHFFDTRRPSWQWPNLISLALTSQLLAPDQRRAGIDNMLEAAAAAAMRMPKLEKMEIWNGREGVAALFSYRATAAGPMITWRGTWEFALRPAVIQAWEKVALKHCGRGCSAMMELLDPAVVKSHGDAIHHLNMLTPVVRPVSLRQIRMEHSCEAPWCSN